MKNIEVKEEAKKYSIIIKKTAQKFLDGLDDKNFNRIDDKIMSLKFNPFPKGIKKLFVYECYRMRVGNFRLLYTVDTKKYEITILDIDNRKDVYKRK